MLECYFISKDINNNLRVPYVKELISYNIDTNTKTNYIEYNGHFYNNILPITCYMFLLQNEAKPYKIEGNTSYYNKIIDEKYIVEIYKKEFIEDISKLNTFNDNNDIIENSRICLTPLNKEKIWFKILNKE